MSLITGDYTVIQLNTHMKYKNWTTGEVRDTPPPFTDTNAYYLPAKPKQVEFYGNWTTVSHVERNLWGWENNPEGWGIAQRTLEEAYKPTILRSSTGTEIQFIPWITHTPVNPPNLLNRNITSGYESAIISGGQSFRPVQTVLYDPGFYEMLHIRVSGDLQLFFCIDQFNQKARAIHRIERSPIDERLKDQGNDFPFTLVGISSTSKNGVPFAL